MTHRDKIFDSEPDDEEFAYEVDAARRNRELVTWLARWRNDHSVSQAEVAKRMQTSQPAIARLESHQHDAQLSTLARYVTALGLSLSFSLADKTTGVKVWTSEDRLSARTASDPDLTTSAAGEEESFARFAQNEFESLVTTLGTITGLPNDESRELVQLAFMEASTRWTDIAVSSNAREWVLGCAIWLYRRRQSGHEGHRDLPSIASAVHESITSALPKSEKSPSTEVRVTGALALAASAAPTTIEAPPRVAEDKVDRADQAVTALYTAHYPSLVRLAALLVRDVATAEDIVRESFVSLHGQEVFLEDDPKAVSYLRQSVVNRSRSLLGQAEVGRGARKPSTEHDAIAQLQRSAVVSALRELPARQREALVLRYYGDMTEAQTAAVMGISRAAVKNHTALAMSALRSVMEREELLDLVSEFGGTEAASLESAVHDFEDPDARAADRLGAKQKLNTFLSQLGGKAQEVAVQILEGYLAARIGM